MKKPPEAALPTSRLADVDPGPAFRIGEVAERLTLSLRSIRYYEEAGLITPSGRTAGGFRLYSELDVQRLLLIMQMRPLDFSLDEMRLVLTTIDLVRQSSTSPQQRAESIRSLEDLVREVDQRWEALRQRMEIAKAFRSYLNAEMDELTTGAPEQPSTTSAAAT